MKYDKSKQENFQEFKKSGLLWFVNRSLHLFGWTIVFVEDDFGVVLDVFPCRVSYRGFPEDVEEENFLKLTKYIADKSAVLLKEIEE